MSGALIQLMASETFKEQNNEVVGLEIGVFVFASAVVLWLVFARS